MIAAFLLSLAAFQTASEPAPVLPAGVRREYQQLVLSIEERLAASDFAGARKLIPLLPKGHLNVKWDDSKVPAEYKPMFWKAAKRAMEPFQFMGDDVIVKYVESGEDLRFSFEPVLANAPGARYPLGSALFFSDARPRLEVVIGLNRGQPLAGIDAIAITNEVMRGVGAYFGLADEPVGDVFMHHLDMPYGMVEADPSIYRKTIPENLAVAHRLAVAAESGKVMQIGRSEIQLDPTKIVMPPIRQGENVPFAFQISNSGNSTLKYRILSDCSCVVTSPGGEVAANSSILVHATFKSGPYNAEVARSLTVLSNDPEEPVRTVDVKFPIKAAYEFFDRFDRIRVAPDKGLLKTFFLVTIPPYSNFEVTDGTVKGPASTMRILPWSGSVNGEKRRGYKIEIDVDGTEIKGLAQFDVTLGSNDPRLSEIHYYFEVQKGLLLQPSDVYFGELDAAPRTASIKVTRPGKPFKVLSAKVDALRFTTKVQKLAEDSYVILVRYDGKASRGPVSGVLTIHTDDKRQSVLHSAISGFRS